MIRNIVAIIAFITMLKILVYLLEILSTFKDILSGAHDVFIKVIELLIKTHMTYIFVFTHCILGHLYLVVILVSQSV